MPSDHSSLATWSCFRSFNEAATSENPLKPKFAENGTLSISRNSSDWRHCGSFTSTTCRWWVLTSGADSLTRGGPRPHRRHLGRGSRARIEGPLAGG